MKTDQEYISTIDYLIAIKILKDIKNMKSIISKLPLINQYEDLNVDSRVIDWTIKENKKII